jgi:hypothetical protein
MESPLVKWHDAQPENPFTPSCGKVICPLSHSDSLADNIDTMRLKREMEDSVKLFAVNASNTIKQMAQW